MSDLRCRVPRIETVAAAERDVRVGVQLKDQIPRQHTEIGNAVGCGACGLALTGQQLGGQIRYLEQVVRMHPVDESLDV